MPFKLGDVFLFVFFALLLHVWLGGKPRSKELARAPQVETVESPAVATVVEACAAVPADPGETATSQPTGRRANVAGTYGTFECVEHRRGDALEVHVRQVTEIGYPLTPVEIYPEPFDVVLDKYTSITSW